MSDAPEKSLAEVVRQDGRYPLPAFVFLNECLVRAAKDVHGEQSDPPRPMHVTGQQLCRGIRDEAVDRWGMLAGTVLAKWNIHSTIDFGNMVYLLIDNDLMHRAEQDSLEDFRDVFDFGEAFGPGEIFGARS